MGRAGVDKLGGLRGVPSAPQKGQMRQVLGMSLAQYGQLYLSGKVLPSIVFPPYNNVSGERFTQVSYSLIFGIPFAELLYGLNTFPKSWKGMCIPYPSQLVRWILFYDKLKQLPIGFLLASLGLFNANFEQHSGYVFSCGINKEDAPLVI